MTSSGWWWLWCGGKASKLGPQELGVGDRYGGGSGGVGRGCLGGGYGESGAEMKVQARGSEKQLTGRVVACSITKEHHCCAIERDMYWRPTLHGIQVQNTH